MNRFTEDADNAFELSGEATAIAARRRELLSELNALNEGNSKAAQPPLLPEVNVTKVFSLDTFG